jgi:hypothetical protein
MAKSKSVSAFSRFNKQQLIVAAVFVLGFGGFGVYKLAFSSAATKRPSQSSVSFTCSNVREISAYTSDSGQRRYILAADIKNTSRKASLNLAWFYLSTYPLAAESKTVGTVASRQTAVIQVDSPTGAEGNTTPGESTPSWGAVYANNGDVNQPLAGATCN